jgi:hypothetical protein
MTSASNAPAPSATAPVRATSIRALLDEMEAAHDRMGADNPHRRLLFDAAQVIVQLAARNVTLETASAEKPRIVLPG